MPALRSFLGWTMMGVSAASILLCCLLGIALGAGGFTFYYAKGWSYLSDDPRACVNCHIMREHYDGWQKGSHHAHATCNSCHTPHDLVGKYLSKAENGFWHSKGFTLQDFPEPIRICPHNAQALQHNCVDCHQELVSEIRGHEEFLGQARTEWSCIEAIDLARQGELSAVRAVGNVAVPETPPEYQRSPHHRPGAGAIPAKAEARAEKIEQDKIGPEQP